MFWQNEEYATGLRREISLDGVICVVDAVFGKKVSYLGSRVAIHRDPRMLANGG